MDGRAAQLLLAPAFHFSARLRCQRPAWPMCANVRPAPPSTPGPGPGSCWCAGPPCAARSAIPSTPETPSGAFPVSQPVSANWLIYHRNTRKKRLKRHKSHDYDSVDPVEKPARGRVSLGFRPAGPRTRDGSAEFCGFGPLRSGPRAPGSPAPPLRCRTGSYEPHEIRRKVDRTMTGARMRPALALTRMAS